MSDDYPDGTVVIETDSSMTPYNVFVKNAEAGWDDRVWSEVGSDVMCTGPTGDYTVIYTPPAGRTHE